MSNKFIYTLLDGFFEVFKKLSCNVGCELDVYRLKFGQFGIEALKISNKFPTSSYPQFWTVF